VGLRFRTIAAKADESWPPGATPEAAVRQIAARKADAVARVVPGAIILGADTVVVLDDEPLAKPSSDEEALGMLRRLAGRRHRVVTGIALLDGRLGARITDAVSTDVWMRAATDDELSAYVASREPADKAGAYGIQGLGAGLITEIRGCYSNVVGLPISRVIEHLQRIMASRRLLG